MVDDWKTKEPTEKQLKAIWNMRRALGSENKQDPKTRGEAFELITKLKSTIQNNLEIGGVINPRHYEKSGDGWNCFNESF